MTDYLLKFWIGEADSFLGASCTTYNDCAGSLVCTDGVCASSKGLMALDREPETSILSLYIYFNIFLAKRVGK